MAEQITCTQCPAVIESPEDNWGSPTRPLCYNCWTELDELRDIFERELDEEVERMR